MGNRFLYLVRHGQHNPAREDEGELTETGMTQASLTARWFRDLSVNALYSSSMLRAVQTASLFQDAFPHLLLKPSDLWRECIPSIPPRLSAYYSANRRRSPPSLEALMQCCERLDQAYSEFFIPTTGEDAVDVIVTHGNVIRYMVAKALDVTVDIWTRMAMYNCGITLIVIDSQGDVSLITHNESGHLPLDVRTHN